MKDLWHKQEQAGFDKGGKKCTQPCSLQPVFTAWWRNGRTDCEELKPQSKENEFLWTREEKEQSIERSGVLRQISIDARGVKDAAITFRCREDVRDRDNYQRIWEDGESDIWEDMIW